MKINETAILKTDKEIEIHAPIGVVWKLLTDIESWPTWHPHISGVKLKGPVEPGTHFEWKSDGFKLHSVIEEVIENSSIGWIGSGFGTSAVHVWEIIPVIEGKVLVRTTESMDGWMVKLFKAKMEKKLNESLLFWLRALRKTAEPD